MKRFVGVVIVALVAVGVFAGGTAVWGSNGAGAQLVAVKPAGLNLLNRTATVLDVLPPAISPAKIGGVDPASVRFIQSGTAGSFWVGLDARGYVCLIVATQPSGDVSGAACISPSDFMSHGLGFRLAGKDHPVVEAYLFPDTVFTGSKASDKVLENVVDAQATVSYYDSLLVLNPAATKVQRAAITSALTGWFELEVLPPAK